MPKVRKIGEHGRRPPTLLSILSWFDFERWSFLVGLAQCWKNFIDHIPFMSLFFKGALFCGPCQSVVKAIIPRDGRTDKTYQSTQILRHISGKKHQLKSMESFSDTKLELLEIE